MEERELITVSGVEEIADILLQFKSRFVSLAEGRVRAEELAAKFAKYGVVIAIKNNEQTIGFSAFYCNDLETKCAFLSMIAVASSYAKNGLGSLLITETKRIAANAGMKKLKLEVLNSNIGAIKFYEKLGFVFCGNAGSDSKYMEIEL